MSHNPMGLYLYFFLPQLWLRRVLPYRQLQVRQLAFTGVDDVVSQKTETFILCGAMKLCGFLFNHHAVAVCLLALYIASRVSVVTRPSSGTAVHPCMPEAIFSRIKIVAVVV
jgi:hypothetical protein